MVRQENGSLPLQFGNLELRCTRIDILSLTHVFFFGWRLEQVCVRLLLTLRRPEGVNVFSKHLSDR